MKWRSQRSQSTCDIITLVISVTHCLRRRDTKEFEKCFPVETMADCSITMATTNTQCHVNFNEMAKS